MVSNLTEQIGLCQDICDAEGVESVVYSVTMRSAHPPSRAAHPPKLGFFSPRCVKLVVENQQPPLRYHFPKKQDADGCYLEFRMRHFWSIPTPFAGQGVLRRQE